MLIKGFNEEHIFAAHSIQNYMQVTSYMTCQHQITYSYYSIWT